MICGGSASTRAYMSLFRARSGSIWGGAAFPLPGIVLPDVRHKVREAGRLRVGANVRKLRKLKGLTQEELAWRVGNTHRHIGQVERGEVNVTIDILTDIAANLSVDPADLFRASPSEPGGGRVYTITQDAVDELERALRIVERLTR